MTTPFEETKENQRTAATPSRSAFVAANAGSGKTRVLTDRVARLLLANTDPAKILCITYTKAAAAEMAERLFKLLGKWALEDDENLAKALNELEGAAKTHSTDELKRARRLFARALETPGGLKIQTIHSFCESVLKRLPIEAGIAPGFNLLEDGADKRLASDAIDRVASRADEPALKAAFHRLGSRFDPETIRKLFSDQITSRQQLLGTIDKAGGWDGLREASAKALGADPNETENNAREKLLSSIDRYLLERTKEVFLQGAKKTSAFARGDISDYLSSSSPDVQLKALTNFFLTSKGLPRNPKGFGDAQTKKVDASLHLDLTAAQENFLAHLEQIKIAATYQDTAAFLTILEEMMMAYTALKQTRAALDYDDLIIATRRLFQDQEQNAWIMYKLDYGLDHILLDEAQDTSPGQWDIIEAPLEEIFSGAGSRSDDRTFFGVGDQKQSIYSFQGADAGLFAEKRATLGKKISSAKADYADVPLTLSFRTTTPVLSFVDALFEPQEALQGLSDEMLVHGVHRAGHEGRVELWPLTRRPEKQEPDAWDAPVDAESAENPTKKLCGQVAATIKGWIGSEELASQSRPIEASDIIILVQSRSPLFHQMIASLSQAGVPVAGADRLQLLEDPAIEDLISYGRSALSPLDDLSLAEILKSPFHGFDDEQLYELAYARSGTLWETLQRRAGEQPLWQSAATAITKARDIGLKDGAFAFYSHLLESGAPSGRKKLFSRLSTSCREPIDEFLRQALDYERSNPRSLQGFISWACENAGEIKRELDGKRNSVRVMTVHGAKGLEGEIVFLLDAHKPPNTKNIGPVFHAPSAENAVTASIRAPILSRSKDKDAPATSLAREEAKKDSFEEYRRLLYVAATRARDRLYICGIESGQKGDPHNKPIAEKNWYALCEDAFERLSGVKTKDSPSLEGVTRFIDSQQEAKPETPETQLAEATFNVPGWLNEPATPEYSTRFLAPSRLADDEEAHSEPAAFSPLRAPDKYFRGRVLHRLLELLPQLPPEKRAAGADALLQKLAASIDEAERKNWRDEVLTVIDDPEFAAAFGPNSRAEVSITGQPAALSEKSKPSGQKIVSGQIDRLVVEEDRVLVIDYKTNRPPPHRAEDVSPSYLAQMGAYRALLQEIYPNKTIISALLWTYEARLMRLPNDLIDHSFARSLT